MIRQISRCGDPQALGMAGSGHGARAADGGRTGSASYS